MADLDRNEYNNYRKSRRDGDPYFDEETEHIDEYFILDERVFVWDKAKNDANKIAHGIDFYTAAYVFNDEYMLEDINSVIKGERRDQAIGEPTGPEMETHPINTAHSKPKAVIGEVEGILFVVFVIEVGNYGKETRIISARAADKEEVEIYFDMKYI